MTTTKLHWHTAAGVTSAASDKYSYHSPTAIGSYYINPVSSPYNVEKHVGYQLMFANDKGKLPGGLWQTFPGLFTLATARQMANNHYQENLVLLLS